MIPSILQNQYGYDRKATISGSISTDADFGFPPWNPPHKHHVDHDGYVTVDGNLEFLKLTNSGEKSLLELGVCRQLF